MMPPHDFTRLVDARGPALVLYARQWRRAPEDVVQDAFLKLAVLRPPPRDPAAWLFRAVRNGAIDAGRKDEVENREKWQTAPLQELPLNELRDYGGAGLRQADFAARLDTPDWQILLKLKRGGYFTLLPDVQQICLPASALKVRSRAEGRFDDALGTAKTMFALSRCLGEHPTFIGEMVGAAVASMAVGASRS